MLLRISVRWHPPGRPRPGEGNDAIAMHARLNRKTLRRSVAAREPTAS